MAPDVNYQIMERRLRLGLTQAQLGDMAGCGQARVSRAERNLTRTDVVEQLDKVLRDLERQRHAVTLAEAEAFWQAVGEAPNRDRIIDRISIVARTLLERSLTDTGLAYRLLDCLPERARDRALRDSGDPLGLESVPLKKKVLGT
ncbi:helix-turn-helix domain-containing protein [Azospirillum sp. sgz302134]